MKKRGTNSHKETSNIRRIGKVESVSWLQQKETFTTESKKLRVWFDACTGKQLRYGVAIAKRLRSHKHDVILTTRKHHDTLGLAKSLDEKVVVVGKYDPSSLGSRLVESIMRQLIFSKMFSNAPPDVAISHQSPDLCRVAFGLGVPVVTSWDTTHATAQNRLTLPLTDVLIMSKAIPTELTQEMSVKKVMTFNGVDEVAWIKEFKPTRLDYEKPCVIVRQTETSAAYAVGKKDLTEKLALKLRTLGNVIFLPRYEKRKRRGLIVPESFVDSVNLVAHADLVISVGGTISREAALQGTPSIVISTFGKSYVNEYLTKKGFPLFTVEASKVMNYAKKYLGKRFAVRDLVAGLENPVDLIESIVKNLIKKTTSKSQLKKVQIRNYKN